jgi:hypothetical protein
MAVVHQYMPLTVQVTCHSGMFQTLNVPGMNQRER